MAYHTHHPKNEWAHYVKQYWAMDNILPTGQVHVQRIVPTGMVELIFYSGDVPTISDDTKTYSDTALFGGQSNQFYDLNVTGHLSLFSIVLQPYGAMMFFDIPMKELTNQHISLKDALGDGAKQFEAQLFETNLFTQKIKITEAFLLSLLHKKRANYNLKRVYHTIELINKSKGIVSVNTLASEACLGRKQFDRVFNENVGILPKQFLKIVRFQNALNIKSQNKTMSLTELAYTCGYADQSHMTREFKLLTGMPPSKYFDECDPISDYFHFA